MVFDRCLTPQTNFSLIHVICQTAYIIFNSRLLVSSRQEERTTVKSQCNLKERLSLIQFIVVKSFHQSCFLHQAGLCLDISCSLPGCSLNEAETQNLSAQKQQNQAVCVGEGKNESSALKRPDLIQYSLHFMHQCFDSLSFHASSRIALTNFPSSPFDDYEYGAISPITIGTVMVS